MPLVFYFAILKKFKTASCMSVHVRRSYKHVSYLEPTTFVSTIYHLHLEKLYMTTYRWYSKMQSFRYRRRLWRRLLDNFHLSNVFWWSRASVWLATCSGHSYKLIIVNFWRHPYNQITRPTFSSLRSLVVLPRHSSTSRSWCSNRSTMNS